MGSSGKELRMGTKVVAHESTGSGTDIFYKREYGIGYYSTLPIGYPFSSLKELLPRTYPGNTRFDSQGEQHLTSAHASTHKLD
ncbi:hypothetical protein MTR_2g035920 [Medicago truncatula]|uniref:Uncharacterized protein n=1 Tax=Medicago truncatula TaxID=3880 RepID=G7IG14_MEDTR|nr:hypothetical protein MTR_2g035920 [Medicago truncatula]